MFTVLPIRYVADVEASRRFYEGLGLSFDPSASVEVWAHLNGDAGAVGVHDAAASKGKEIGATELALGTDERLEDLRDRLIRLGYNPELFAEDFGRSLRLIDPDGVVVQIQEIDIATMKRSAAAL